MARLNVSAKVHRHQPETDLPLRWMPRAGAAALLLATGAALSQQIPRYPPNPTGPPAFEADNPEGLIFAGRRTDGRHAWKRKVHWRSSTDTPAPSSPLVPRASAAELQAMTRTLDALVGVFKATPSGSKGEGFWVNDSRRVGFVNLHTTPPGAPPGRWPMQFASGLFPFYHEDDLRGGTWRLSIKSETEATFFSFNQMPGAVGQTPIAQEPATGPDRLPVELFLRPRVTDSFFGLPIYERNLLLIARPGRDPWAAVTLGRALRATLPLFEKDRENAEQRLARLREENDKLQSPAWEQAQRDEFEKNNGALRETRPSNYAVRLANMERYIGVTRAEAAAKANPQRDAAGAWYWNPVDAHAAARRQAAELTPAQAAAPACFVEAPSQPGADGIKPSEGRYAMRGDLVAVGSAADCRELVVTNPSYFDLNLPRTAPQIMTLDVGRCHLGLRDGLFIVPTPGRWDSPPHGCHRHRTMWNEADWKAIAALIAP